MATTCDLTPLDPDEQLGYLLARAADQVSRPWHAALKSAGINPRQLSMLALLARDPGMSQAELARRVMITPQSTSESLVRLVAAGFVTRTDESPGRSAALELTAKGRRLLSRARPIIERSNEESFAMLSVVERAELSRLLTKVLAG